MRGRVFRNYYEGHMHKTGVGDGSKVVRWVFLLWGREWLEENADNCN